MSEETQGIVVTDEGNISLTETDVPHLSPVREKILVSLLNPEFVGLTVTEKCQRIGVSRDSWYKALHDSEFMELVRKTGLDVLKEGVAGVMAALIKSASNPSPKASPDRRLFFELTGYIVKPEESKVLIVNVGEAEVTSL